MSKYYVPSTPIIIEDVYPISTEDLKDLNIVPPKKNNEIGIMIVHFLRDKILLNLIKSIFKYQPGVKIYIADQSVFDSNREILYKLLQDAGHEIYYTGFDSGLSFSRNFLVNKIKEPYIFFADNDNEFLAETNLNKLKQILIDNSTIGMVGMEEYQNDIVNHYEINLEIKDKKIFYKKAISKEKNFFYCDMVMNVGLARKELFKEALWDVSMKLCEHLDWFLTIKYKTNWEVVCSRIKIGNQNIDIKNPIYLLFRNRNNYFWQYYIDKWNVDSLVDFQGKVEKIVVFPFPKNEQSPKITQKVVDKESVIEPEVPIIVIPPVIKSDIEINIEILPNDLLKELLSTNIKFWLLKRSCLEIIRDKKLTSKILSIGVKTQENRIYLLTLFANKREYLDIIVDANRTLKTVQDINNNIINVPCPVVAYLQHRFGAKYLQT